MIDLHCHSSFSDGALSPQALLAKAVHAGITMLALTDHDTVEGVRVLKQGDLPLAFIPGIELSVRWKKVDIHVLGLNIDIEHPLLNALIEQQNTNRLERSHLIAERMAALGIDQAFEKACQIAGHERIGRPHFAQVFINEGKAADIQSAFKRYLGRGRPAYVPTPWISITEAVEGISAAGGHATLAHPLKYRLTRTKLNELLLDFKQAGGRAVEVVSGESTALQAQEVAGLCMRFQLLASTGSDFHSEASSRISLGRQRELPLNCMPVWHQWTI
jgi:predicted metal-dependent phosphoesterase TrpH